MFQTVINISVLFSLSLFSSCRDSSFTRSNQGGGTAGPMVDPNGRNVPGGAGSGSNGTGGTNLGRPGGSAGNGTGQGGSGVNGSGGSGSNGGIFGGGNGGGYDPSPGSNNSGSSNAALIGTFDFLASILNLGRGNPFAATISPTLDVAWHIGDPASVNVGGADIHGYSSSSCLGRLDSRNPDSRNEARFSFRTTQANTRVNAYLVYCGIDNPPGMPFSTPVAMLQRVGPNGEAIAMGPTYNVAPTQAGLFSGEGSEARQYVTPNGLLNKYINLPYAGVYKIRFVPGKRQSGNFLDTDNVYISKVRIIPDKPIVTMGFEGG